MFAHVEQSRFRLDAITCYGVDGYHFIIYCGKERFESRCDTKEEAAEIMDYLDKLFSDFCIAPKFVKIGEARIGVDDILKYYLDGDDVLIVELRSQPNNDMRLSLDDSEHAKKIIYDLDLSLNTVNAKLEH